MKILFGLWSGNVELIESCRSISEIPVNNEDDASTIIIGALHKKLRETHKMSSEVKEHHKIDDIDQTVDRDHF